MTKNIRLPGKFGEALGDLLKLKPPKKKRPAAGRKKPKPKRGS